MRRRVPCSPTLNALADCVRHVRPGLPAFVVPDSGPVREWIEDQGLDDPMVLALVADAIRWAELRAGRPIVVDAL